MKKARAFACGIVPLVLAAACALLYLARSPRIETSLYDLIGSAGKAIPAALRNSSNGLVPVLVFAPDFDSACAAATNLEARLLRDCPALDKVHVRTDGRDFSGFLGFCRTYPAGLVSPVARTLLQTPEGRAKLARRALRTYFATPIPPLFSPVEDPFGLLNGYISSLPAAYAGWKPREGFLTAQKGQTTVLLLLLEFKPGVETDVRKLVDFKADLDRFCAQVVRPPVAIVACGVPVHTAETAARCQTEMSVLTFFSVIFIVILSLVVFKSLRWIPCVFLTLLCAALAGGAALLACFPSIHALTFVLGTTVLGLVVDYAFHRLLQAPGNAAAVSKGLCISCLTTEISLLPLLFCGIPVLRQSAVFLGVGLAASLGSVLFLYPRIRLLTGSPGERLLSGPLLPNRVRICTAPLFGIAFLLSIGLLLHARFATEPQAIYRPSPTLAAAERFLAERSGASTNSTLGFLVIEGADTPDALIRKEESLHLSDDLPHLSRFLPSFPVRQKIAAQVAALYAEQGAAQAAALGLGTLPLPRPPKPWEWSELPSAVTRAFVRGHALVSLAKPLPEGAVMPEGAGFWRPKETLGRILTDWTRLSAHALAFSLVLILAVLGLVYRRQAPIMLVPSLFALAFAGGLLVLRGEAVNLFHLLAGFLLTGMSVDYTIFLRTGGRAAFRPALCSMLTSLAGFGALVFVSFPVVKAFGFVLGVGLPAAFLCALLVCPGTCAASTGSASILNKEKK